MQRRKSGGGAISRKDVLALALALSAAAVLTHLHTRSVDLPHLASRLQLHQQIIEGDAPAPYRYRVLVPAAVEALRRVIAVVLPPQRSFIAAYAIYDFVAIAFLLVALYARLRRWFRWEAALVGILFVASVIPEVFTDHYFQPWSMLEAGLLCAALMLAEKRRFGWAAAITALATLNKETAFIIPAAVALMYVGRGIAGSRRGLAAGALSGVVWLAVYLGLRFVLGRAPFVEPPSTIVARNLAPHNLARAALHAALFFGALWVFVALGWRRAPGPVRRAARSVPVYLAAVAVWGVWYEARLLMPLYPLLVPVALAYVFEPRAVES
jgi:hypothetical protein